MADPEARVDALVQRFNLPANAGRKLSEFCQLLTDDPLAPTAVREHARVIDDHLADSLVAVDLEQVRSASRIADLGSGAGLPGIPLAVALPHTTVFLLESARRKCAFLELAVARSELTNAEVVSSRAEAWAGGRGWCDVVVARALAPLEVVVEYAAPLLRVGGTLVVWRGRRDEGAEDAAARAAAVVGLRPREIIRVQPFAGSEHRHLHLMSKVMETPPAYPRRPGMALKRPLGNG